MKRFKILICTLTLTFGASFSLVSQNLVINLLDDSQEIFPISSINSIKFGASTMILNEIDGTVTTWNINDIVDYSFDDTLSLYELDLTYHNKLTIYPNPTKNLLTIDFYSNQSENINIEIVDALGRIVDLLYNGSNQGRTVYEWNVNVSNGTYYCKITTDTKLIVKPFIVNN